MLMPNDDLIRLGVYHAAHGRVAVSSAASGCRLAAGDSGGGGVTGTAARVLDCIFLLY
jgi:hypothetical protein